MGCGNSKNKSMTENKYDVMNDTYDYLFKFIIIGDSNVGKSSLMLRFAENKYNPTYISTVGVEFRVKTIMINGIRIKIQIWDTAGQEKFKSLTKSYYRGAHGVIIMYDITNYKSFVDMVEWVKDVNTNINGETPIIIVGNKVDLDQCRTVGYREGEDEAIKLNADFVEISVKDNKGVNKVFEKISQRVMEKL